MKMSNIKVRQKSLAVCKRYRSVVLFSFVRVAPSRLILLLFCILLLSYLHCCKTKIVDCDDQ